MFGFIKKVASVGLKVAGVASSFIDPTGTLGRGLSTIGRTLAGANKTLSALDAVVKNPKLSKQQKEAYIKAYGGVDPSTGSASNEQVSDSVQNILDALKNGNLKDIKKRVEKLKPDEAIKLYSEIQKKNPGLLVQNPALIGIFTAAFEQKRKAVEKAQG